MSFRFFQLGRVGVTMVSIIYGCLSLWYKMKGYIKKSDYVIHRLF